MTRSPSLLESLVLLRYLAEVQEGELRWHRLSALLEAKLSGPNWYVMSLQHRVCLYDAFFRGGRVARIVGPKLELDLTFPEAVSSAQIRAVCCAKFRWQGDVPEPLSLASEDFWDALERRISVEVFDYGPRVSSGNRPLRLVSKAFRDPRQFVRDSRNPLVRAVGRLIGRVTTIA